MKLSRVLFGAALTLGIASAAAAAKPAPDTRPALLILGTPHFDNPGLDIVNTKIEDVLAAERQREIEAIVDRLAAFRPTRVAVEWRSKNQAKLDQRYADYRAGRYTLSRDERDQIGLRLAAKLGLDRVDAIDWNEMPPGAEADYDFVAYAEKNGMAEAFAATRKTWQSLSGAESRLMACTPVGSWLYRLNTPEARARSHLPYYNLSLIGDAETNPGAAWVGSWYGRNFRIFANLARLAAKPDERVVVIYGAGHGFLLDQFARESGRFAVADPIAWLPRGSAVRKTGCGG